MFFSNCRLYVFNQYPNECVFLPLNIYNHYIDGGETLFERGKPVDDGQVDKIDGITALEEYESDADILKSLKRGDFYKHRQRRNNQGNIIPPDTSSNPLSLFKQGSWEERMVYGSFPCFSLFVPVLSLMFCIL